MGVAQSYWSQATLNQACFPAVLALAVLLWQSGGSRVGVMLCWSFSWGRREGGTLWIRGVRMGEDGVVQTRSCCWILVLQQKVRDSPRWIIHPTGPASVPQPHQATAAAICSVWCCCWFPAERLQTWAAVVKQGSSATINKLPPSTRVLARFMFCC